MGVGVSVRDALRRCRAEGGPISPRDSDFQEAAIESPDFLEKIFLMDWDMALEYEAARNEILALCQSKGFSQKATKRELREGLL